SYRSRPSDSVRACRCPAGSTINKAYAMSTSLRASTPCLILDLSPLPVFLGAQFRRERRAKIRRLEHRPNLDLRILGHRIGAALHPLDGLLDGFHLPQPEAGDQFLGLGEGSVEHRPLLAREPYTLAPCARLQSLARQEDTRFDEGLIELPHRAQQGFTRNDARFAGGS